jgi:Putative zinc-finger
MQHLDEGTIHSWLDGALSADEAARVQAHVAECPQCAAAVAEARGFIAASSRILTALDHVPRAVVPVALPVRWYNRAAWRAAAAVLVVAVGSLVVVRNSGRERPVARVTFDTASISRAPVTQSQNATAAPQVAATSKTQTPIPAAPSKSEVIVTGAASEATFSGKPAAVTARPNTPARDQTLGGAVGGEPSSGYASAPSQAARARAAAPTAPPAQRAADLAAPEAPIEQAPLKVVGTPRVPGAKVTLYEVVPGDTVAFTEPVSLQLSGVVTTAAGGAEPMTRRSAKSAGEAPTSRVDAAGAVNAQQAGKERMSSLTAPSAALPPSRVQIANGVTTISWPDPNTGNMLTLSGRLPAAQLQQIRIRIERERAAAAAAKKP